MGEPVWSRVDSVEHVPVPGASDAPCSGCIAPCCWNVKLHSIRAATWDDLDYVTFLLGFPEIEVVYLAPDQLRVFYRVPCTFLDVESGRFDCTLHGAPQKPAVCVEFDERDCFYQRAMLGTPRDGIPAVRLDLRRWRAIASLFAVDEAGQVIDSPLPGHAWSVIQELPPEPAPALRRLNPSLAELATDPLGFRPYDTTRDPCTGCAAPCCRVLVFERLPPTSLRSLEYMRYQLGFPNVSVVVTPAGWRTLVRTTCSHLDLATSRCSLFGRPERPLTCSRYNQYVCDYRRFFTPGNPDVLHMDLAGMAQLIRTVPTSEDGYLPTNLSLPALRGWLHAA